MSYRTIKRVLGEASLERKCRLLFGAVLLVLVGGSFYLYGRLTEYQVRIREFENGSHRTKSLLDVLHWKVHTRTHDLKFQIQVLFENPGDKLIPLSEQAAYQEVFDRFHAGEDQFVRREPGKNDFQYYGAVRAEASCLNCHYTPLTPPVAKAEGDLMAVSVIPMSAGAKDFSRSILMSCAILTVSAAMAAAYFIVRYVTIKPLRHLKDVSDEISRGNLNLRSEIHTGDEFEELSRAFNRMLRSLVDMQQELRRVNSDLDGKVDQLAQANMALFESNRLKSDFLATVSHELRTPLNSILGFSEVLASGAGLSDKQRRWIQNIQSSGKSLLAMINDFLDLAKIESGKMELQLVDLSVPDLVEVVMNMMRPLAEKKNIDLDSSVAPAMPLVHQDARKVQQILENLVSNAVKFTPEGGRVELVAQLKNEHLMLRVTDTGVGIAESDQAYIFEKFRQGSAARPGGDWAARDYQGTGLGLSIVKELCRLLHGEVALHSELGKGSTFTVRIPARLDQRPRIEMTSMTPSVDLAQPRRVDERLATARQAG